MWSFPRAYCLCVHVQLKCSYPVSQSMRGRSYFYFLTGAIPLHTLLSPAEPHKPQSPQDLCSCPRPTTGRAALKPNSKAQNHSELLRFMFPSHRALPGSLSECTHINSLQLLLLQWCVGSGKNKRNFIWLCWCLQRVFKDPTSQHSITSHALKISRQPRAQRDHHLFLHTPPPYLALQQAAWNEGLKRPGWKSWSRMRWRRSPSYCL